MSWALYQKLFYDDYDNFCESGEEKIPPWDYIDFNEVNFNPIKTEKDWQAVEEELKSVIKDLKDGNYDNALERERLENMEYFLEYWQLYGDSRKKTQ